MKTMISKEVTFDCAHMLSGHNGLCKNLHGHTYKLQIQLCDILIDKKGSSSDQMIMDFAILKQLIHDIILSRFDHSVIISAAQYRSEAENELLDWVKRNEMRHVVLSRRTTAESIAYTIGKLIYTEFFNSGIEEDKLPVVTVKLWETPTSCAEVTYNG